MSADDHISDPDTYARIAEPYACAEEAEAALCAFYDELRKVRELHRIAEVVSAAVVFYGPEKQPIMMRFQAGDSTVAPIIAARLFGEYRDEALRPLNQAAGIGEER